MFCNQCEKTAKGTGCDGRQRSREYYTEFTQVLPMNTVILAAGCAKYRYNNLDLSTAGGLPRVIDAGGALCPFFPAVQTPDGSKLTLPYTASEYRRQQFISHY